jgi:sialic acid synthase SpsE
MNAQDIVALRPVSDISPMEIDKLIGRTLKVPVAKESGFAWNQFDPE